MAAVIWWALRTTGGADLDEVVSSFPVESVRDRIESLRSALDNVHTLTDGLSREAGRVALARYAVDGVRDQSGANVNVIADLLFEIETDLIELIDAADTVAGLFPPLGALHGERFAVASHGEEGTPQTGGEGVR